MDFFAHYPEFAPFSPVCETCLRPRKTVGGRFCKACWTRRCAPHKQIREIRKQLAFIRREMKLRWLYEQEQVG